MPGKRLYSEKEISAVLKRAAELQQSQGAPEASGLSLEELEQVAAEVGIDPAFVHAAARDLEAAPSDDAFHFWGGPGTIEVERIVEGALTEDRWEEAVAEIRRVYGVAGETGTVGRTREWVLRNMGGERVHVTMTPTGSQTRIRIVHKIQDWAVATFAPLSSIVVLMTVFIYALLSLGPLAETGLVLLSLVAIFMAGRLGFGAAARSQDRKARKLMARLDDLFAREEPVTPEKKALPEETAPEATTREAASEASLIDPRLLLDDEETDASSAAPEQARKRTR